MTGGMSSVSASLSSIYSDIGNQLSTVMQQIASGKKFTQPSDDYVSFLQSSTLQNDVNSYTTVNGNIAQAKVYTDAAAKAGNQVYADLTSLQNLNTEYTNTSDANQQASLSTQFDALAKQIAQEITSSTYDGTALLQAGNITSVNLDTSATNTLAITPTTVTTAAQVTALVGKIGAAGGTAALGTAAAPGTALTNMSTFLSEINAYGATLTNQTNLNNTIVASENATITAVSGIDEASALTQETNLQVQQQASVSMMSQANISAQGIVKLFQ